MPETPLDKETARSRYAELVPKYKRLGENLREAFKDFLRDAGIDVLEVICRIKDFDSFWDKVQRKNYEDPFQEVEDICGIRIICFYPSDLEKISQIIRTECNVIVAEDKAGQLKPYEFGYRSFHFIVTLKDDWLNAPNYRGLKGLKAEVQVRTILMHAWAGIAHKLAYKKEEQVPEQFKRKLYQLSALFENSDGQLDSLRNERENYIENLVSKDSFDVNLPMDLDTLQALMDFYYPNRDRSLDDTSTLLDEIFIHNISIKRLVEDYERVKEILPSAEADGFIDESKDARLAQAGIIRLTLDLTEDDYWKDRIKLFKSGSWNKAVLKWRAELSKQNR